MTKIPSGEVKTRYYNTLPIVLDVYCQPDFERRSIEEIRSPARRDFPGIPFDRSGAGFTCSNQADGPFCQKWRNDVCFKCVLHADDSYRNLCVCHDIRTTQARVRFYRVLDTTRYLACTNPARRLEVYDARINSVFYRAYVSCAADSRGAC